MIDGVVYLFIKESRGVVPVPVQIPKFRFSGKFQPGLRVGINPGGKTHQRGRQKSKMGIWTVFVLGCPRGCRPRGWEIHSKSQIQSKKVVSIMFSRWKKHIHQDLYFFLSSCYIFS